MDRADAAGKITGLTALMPPYMALQGDRRGQSVQLGAVLLFGIIVIALTGYQAVVVPQQNAEVEFDTYLTATEDMESLRAALSVATRGDTTSSTVRTGVSYPFRGIFINPPPTTGSLDTGEPRTVTVENATVVDGGNAAAYWSDQEKWNYTTKPVVFRPSYNEFDGEPLVVTPTFAYREAGDGIALTAQSLIQNDRITLGLVDGRVASDGLTTSVLAEPVSPATRSIPITGDGTDINLTIETWSDAGARLLAEELNASVDEGSLVSAVPVNDSVRVRLNGSRTYELRVAKVSVRTRSKPPLNESVEPAYVLAASPEDQLYTDNQTATFVAEVRDRYNNPVDGEPVTFNFSDSAFECSDGNTITTDEAGRATCRVDLSTVEETGDFTVTASFDSDDPDAVTEVTFSFTIVDSDAVTGNVGTSGTEEWSPDDSSTTLSSKGGLWTNVTGVQQVILTEPRFSPTRASDATPSSDKRHFRLVYSVTNGTTTYHVLVTNSKEGLIRQLGNGWSNREVRIMEQDGETVERDLTAKLDTDVLDDWFDPSAETDGAVYLLNMSAYGGESAGFRELLTDLKQFHRHSELEIFVADFHGRVRINATDVGKAHAYPDEYVDDDGSVGIQENRSLPPGSFEGPLSSFAAMQKFDPSNTGSSSLEEGDATGDSDYAMNITTATYGVRNASAYNLTVRYRYDSSDTLDVDDEVNVTIVDADGTVLQSVELARTTDYTNETIRLNAAAVSAVQDSGNLYVVYRTQQDGTQTLLYVRFQKIEVA